MSHGLVSPSVYARENGSGSTYQKDDQSNDKNGSEYAAADVHKIPLRLITPTRHWTTKAISGWYATAHSAVWNLLNVGRSDLIFPLRESDVTSGNGSPHSGRLDRC